MGVSKAQCGQILAMVFSVTALIVSIMTATWCEVIEFEPSNSTVTQALRFGIWRQAETEALAVTDSEGKSFYVYETCQKYDDSVKIDSKWKAARAFSVMTPILGFFLLVPICAGNKIGAMKWKAIAMKFMVLLPLFQGLTLLIYKSNACVGNPLLDVYEEQPGIIEKIKETYPSECKMGPATGIIISATVLWFLTGLTMMALGNGDEDEVVPKERNAATTGVDGKLDVAEGEEQVLQEQTEFQA